MATIVTRSGKGSPLTNTEVDSNFTNLNTDKLELSGGTLTGNLSFGNNNKAIFNSDLEVYRTNTDAFIDEKGSGWLYIRGNNTVIGKYTGETYIKGIADGAVELYHDNVKMIETTASGISVSGNVVVSGTVDGRDVATDGAKLDGIATLANNYTHPNHSGEVTSSADGATVIADNVVDEANLKISNTPTNGYVLTAQSGNTGGLTWAEAASGADLYAANDVNATAPSATGNNSVAIGPSSEANSADATAFGYRSEAKASKAVAIGEGRAGGNNATAISIGTTSTAYGATGSYSVAMGYQANATGTYAFALGSNSVSTGQESFALGKARSVGISSFAALIDNNTTTYGATNNRGIAIGYLASAGTASVCIGYGSWAGGSHSYAIGRDSSNQSYSDTYSFGRSIFASASNQVNIAGAGQDVRISETYTLPKVDGTASGQVLTTDGSGTVSWAAAGGGGADLYTANESSPAAQPSATGTNAIAIGDSAVSSGADGIAIGLGATQTATHNSGANAIAIGANTVADGYSTAIGAGTGSNKTTASGNSCLAIGYTATSTGTLATAIGKGRASGDRSFAANIDNNTTSYGASGANSIAMGSLAKANQANGIAIGKDTLVDGGADGIALGRNARAGNNAISIGQTGWGGGQSYASGQASISIGQNNLAQQSASVVIGIHGHSNTVGKYVYSSGYLGGQGNAQAGTFILIGNTTDATAKALGTNTSTLSSTNQIVLPNDSCYGFTGTVIARENSAQTNDFAVWEIKGGAVRAASASTTALGTYNINKISESTGATNWGIALSADTTNGAVAITVTGEASHNIRWVATVNTTEVTY